MSETEQWFIIRQAGGECEIVEAFNTDSILSASEKWGPFSSKSDAIARRVGLIRAGKCRPV